MLDSIYDEQLLSLKKLKWLPWIGGNYTQNLAENKILLIGESHYFGDKPNNKEEYEQREMTRLIVADMGVNGNKWGSDFFVNTFKVLLTDNLFDDRHRRILWDNVAFYNFIQVPMTNKKIRPQKEELIDAQSNFLDLLSILKPAVCVFLGLKAEQNLNDAIKTSNYKLHTPICRKEKIRGSHGRYGEIETDDGHITKLIFVRHPSQYFSYKSWNKFLLYYIPDQLDWLKHIS